MEQEFKHNDIGVIWFVRDRCDGWPSRAKIAYVMLYSRMGADRWVWPSKGRLAADMSMKKDAAIAAVKDLQQMQLLQDRQPTHNPETGAQGTTRYRLRPPWEADYTSCPAYAPKSTAVALQPTGGVVSTDMGESDKPTGGVGSTDRGLSDQQTGASRLNRHEGNQEKVTIEANQQEAETRAAAPLPPDLISTLQRQVSSRLVMMKIADLHRQYGEKRLRFAGARVEEERRERRESDRDALSNPVARFIGIVMKSSDEEADAYFEELAKAKAQAAAAHEDPRDRIRRARHEHESEQEAPPDEDDPEEERLRAIQRQLLQLGGQRPKSTDEIDGRPLLATPAPALPRELTPEEKTELEERKAAEARLADINRQRHVAVNRKMSQVVVETQDLPAGAHAVVVYERLLEFIDGPDYQEIGDGADPVRADYSQRLEEARARAQRAG